MLPMERVASVKLGPEGVATSEKLVAPAPSALSSRYPVTPTLSVAAVQLRSIRFELIGVATSPVGTDGGVVSGGGFAVVAVAPACSPVRFPTASADRTR